MKNRIFLLIGFMACGKSYYGEKCAKQLNYDFIDLDKYIEKKESKTIKEIFETKGEVYFRLIETSYLKEILESINKDIIISVGGGFPLREENQILMKKANVIFIDTEFDCILSRLDDKERAKRPLLAFLDCESIKKLYIERYKIYINTANFVARNYSEVIEYIK